VTDPVELHPDLAAIGFLVGTWRGEGRGDYPTIEPFRYLEEVTFGTVPGKPFLTYHQKTRSPGGGPLHTEFGYVRPVGDDEVELVLAQPSGITEIHAGTIDGTTIAFVTVDVGVAPTAKDVRSVARALRVEGDVLSYRLDMASVGQDLQFHLEATLRRVPV
jgi:hypothetical protein